MPKNLVHTLCITGNPIGPCLVSEDIMNLSHSIKCNNPDTVDLESAIVTEGRPCTVFHLLYHDANLLLGKRLRGGLGYPYGRFVMGAFVLGYKAPQHIDGSAMKLIDGFDGIIPSDQFDQFKAFYVRIKRWTGRGPIAASQQESEKDPNPIA